MKSAASKSGNKISELNDDREKTSILFKKKGKKRVAGAASRII
jgi:hypothetical protein